MKQDFVLPPKQVYLVGNSLGAMPRAVPSRMKRLLEQQWGATGVAAWNDAHWFDMPRRVGDKLATLIGAQAGEVVATDSTSVNLYKLIHQALMLRPERGSLVVERDAFPTDNYVAQGLAQQLGKSLHYCQADDLSAMLGPDIAVVVLGHVNYRTGRRWDMAQTTQRIHAAGALVVWDLAHSAGAVPLAVSKSAVDFAVGCGYKYLNGGPGAPAFAYASQRYHAQMAPVLQGWFGHARPFAFEPNYAPAPDAAALQVGTPGILGLSALDTALDLFSAQPLERLHEQAQDMLDELILGFKQHAGLQEFVVLTPPQREQRGNQISVTHPQAQAIGHALIEQGVVGDFRPPNILRWGIAPLYTDRQDISRALDTLQRIMQDGLWQSPRFQLSKTVT